MPPVDPLVQRVKASLSGAPRLQEKRMFGGVTFMVRGKMCVSVGKGRIMCRIDPSLHDAALKRKGARTVVMKGREYRGWRSEEHTSELQSQSNLVCRLLL